MIYVTNTDTHINVHSDDTGDILHTFTYDCVDKYIEVDTENLIISATCNTSLRIVAQWDWAKIYL